MNKAYLRGPTKPIDVIPTQKMFKFLAKVGIPGWRDMVTPRGVILVQARPLPLSEYPKGRMAWDEAK